MYRTYIMISGLLCFGIVSNNKYLCSLHGLIRGENMELGRDSDTGGQVLFRHKCLFFDFLLLFHLKFSSHIPLILFMRQFFYGFLCRYQNNLVIFVPIRLNMLWNLQEL